MNNFCEFIHTHEEGYSQMPIAPKGNPPLGYYLSAITADAFARANQSSTILPFNTSGEKTNLDTTNPVEALDFMKRLGIENPFVWMDGSRESLSHTAKFINDGIDAGYIYEEFKEIYFSADGRVEFLDTSENLYPRINDRSEYAYYIKDGKPYLKGTGALITKELKQCLMLRLPENKPNINVYPNYAKAEFDQIYSSFAGRSILISRLGSRAIKIDSRNRSTNFNIDTDLNWMPFMSILQEYHFMYVQGLVVVNRTIKQSVLSCMMNQLAGADLPESIIVMPRIDLAFEGDTKMKSNEMEERYGARALRLLLLQGLGVERKNIVLNSSLIHLINRTLEDFDSSQLDCINPTVEELTSGGNPNMLPAELKRIRQNRIADLQNLTKWLLLTTKNV